MADESADRLLLNEVLTGAEAMGSLAVDDEVFRAAVDAFRALDGESMHALLERHGLLDRCEVICHWLRSKEAILLCLWLAGPPPVTEEQPPDAREFAEVVAKVTADEELVELLAAAVQERDQKAWRELIETQKLERYSHLLSHWVCVVYYRLVCEVVCTPIRIERPQLIPELAAAGQAVGRLAANEKAFAAVEKAVLAGNCELIAWSSAGSGSASTRSAGGSASGSAAGGVCSSVYASVACSRSRRSSRRSRRCAASRKPAASWRSSALRSTGSPRLCCARTSRRSKAS